MEQIAEELELLHSSPALRSYCLNDLSSHNSLVSRLCIAPLIIKVNHVFTMLKQNSEV